jgi:hypothetical protein
MDSARFDRLAKMLGTLSTRRAGLSLLSALGLGGALVVDVEAKKHKKKKCKKGCPICQKCKKGKCKPQPDGTACGGGATCQGGQCICPTECCADADCGACETCETGQCVNDCRNDQVCDGDTCVCPDGQKECQGACIDDSECCGACPAGQVCCTNVGECKDTHNDKDFCGGCVNHACSGSEFCANGACSLTCTTFGASCFSPDCFCAGRADPAHEGDSVCVRISPATCDSVATCSNDTTCGFGEVCVADFCASKKVCAFPCA